MRPEPARHARRSIRLKEYDYSQPGRYFVTICTHGGGCALGSIQDEMVGLSPLGVMIEKCWLDIASHFPGVELDGYVVMPNHLHGIIGIVGRGEAFALHPRHSSLEIDEVGSHGEVETCGANASPLQLASSTDVTQPRQMPKGTRPGSLAAVVQNFKAVTTRRARRLGLPPGAALWQRNYYEHVIRGDRSLEAIREYIRRNPANWPNDEYYTGRR